jgi:hypothetical protein
MARHITKAAVGPFWGTLALRRLCIVLLMIYRACLSPLLGPACRFHPMFRVCPGCHRAVWRSQGFSWRVGAAEMSSLPSRRWTRYGNRRGNNSSASAQYINSMKKRVIVFLIVSLAVIIGYDYLLGHGAVAAV